MRLVDLSHVIAPSPPDQPAFLRTDIEYSAHDAGAAEFESLLGTSRSLLRDGEGPASERLTIGTHAATHVDAPWHYNSVIAGRPATTIDALELDRFYGPGVVVDARDKADGDPVTAEEMRAGIAAAGHTLQPGDIVLVRTERDRFYADRDYMWKGCGVTPEATVWLYEQGIRTVGIDAWGWDAPLDRQAEAANAAGRTGILWGAHQVDLPYCQIERLTNLAALPPTGFHVACFPLKIKDASAAPARVVAFVEEP